MVKINKTEHQAKFKYRTPKGIRDFQQNCDTKSVAIMVERFVQSIANVNDSGSFETSFEVKTIQPKRTAPYIRHRCVTELDRESLERFVKAFEEKNIKTQTLPIKNQNEQHLDIMTLMASTPVKNDMSSSMVSLHRKESAVSTDSDIGSSDCGHDEGSTKTPPKVLYINQKDNLRVPSPTGKSACKVLQFFSSAKKKVQTLRTPSRSTCSSATASPIMMRAQFGCKSLHNYHQDTDADEEDNDDGISLTEHIVSRNTSPDSSFEMQAPLIPIFKITPPRTTKTQQRNPAYELARIIRGSFHAKRASVSKLRRTLSDPDNNNNQNKGDKDGTETKQEIIKNIFVKAKNVEHRTGVVGDATIKNLDVIRVSHF